MAARTLEKEEKKKQVSQRWRLYVFFIKKACFAVMAARTLEKERERKRGREGEREEARKKEREGGSEREREKRENERASERDLIDYQKERELSVKP